MTFDLELFQSEHLAWATRNFGPRRNPIHATFGMAEEVGELAQALVHAQSVIDSALPIREVVLMELIAMFGRLCHVDLKDAQGIRRPKPALRLAIIQQLDILLAAYVKVATDDSEVPSAEDVASAHAQLHELCTPISDVDARELAADAIGDASIFGADVASGLELSFAGCIENAWNEVRDRDWVANPQNGITA